MKPLRFFGLIVLLLLIIYSPALKGEFLIDDRQFLVGNWHITHGPTPLYFWTSLTQIDYWPLHYTALWFLWRVFGAHPLGYHLVNLFVHAANAALLYRILRCYQFPAAFIAALLFAVHPLNTEAVAWIFQLKTLLATLFFLLAWDAYLQSRFQRSVFCFFLGLCAKTSVILFPVSLVPHHLWRRDLSMEKLIRRLTPYTLVALVLGSLAYRVSRYQAAKEGLRLWDAGIDDKALTAAYNLSFYLGKFFFPHPLLFEYPRFVPSAESWPVYVPLAILLLLILARSRFGLAAFGFFVVNLLPALGFIAIPFMHYSLVADHWAYLGAIGLLLPAAAMLHRAGRIGWVTALGILGWLTFQQAHLYRSNETLWRATLAGNPAASLATYNLAVLCEKSGRTTEAQALFRKTTLLDPWQPKAHVHLGNLAVRRNNYSGALEEYGMALRVRPRDVDTLSNLCAAAIHVGRLRLARAACGAALALDPNHLPARVNLAAARPPFP